MPVCKTVRPLARPKRSNGILGCACEPQKWRCAEGTQRVAILSAAALTLACSRGWIAFANTTDSGTNAPEPLTSWLTSPQPVVDLGKQAALVMHARGSDRNRSPLAGAVSLASPRRSKPQMSTRARPLLPALATGGLQVFGVTTDRTIIARNSWCRVVIPSMCCTSTFMLLSLWSLYSGLPGDSANLRAPGPAGFTQRPLHPRTIVAHACAVCAMSNTAESLPSPARVVRATGG